MDFANRCAKEPAQVIANHLPDNLPVLLLDIALIKTRVEDAPC